MPARGLWPSRGGRELPGLAAASYRIQFDHYTGVQALAEMETFGFKPSNYPSFAKFVLGFTGLP